MSKHLVSLVYHKRIGSMTRKAVRAYCADRANDDGSAVYCSKARIAREIECGKKTVIETLRRLVADGLMREIGQRRHEHGYTVEYALVPASITALPDVKEVQDRTSSGLEPHPFDLEPVPLQAAEESRPCA